MCMLNVGIPVTLLDRSEDDLRKGVARIEANYKRSRTFNEETFQQRMALLTTTSRYEDFGEVDLVVEAVFEAIDLKRDVFAKLDAACKPGCFLWTNTSGLDIDDIAAATGRPGLVLGAHFFSPANVMKLLEIVRGRATEASTIASAIVWGKQLLKVPVVVGNIPGFAGNRVLSARGAVAGIMTEHHGLDFEKFDAVEERFGWKMGLYRMGDNAGLAIGVNALKSKGIDPLDPSNGFAMVLNGQQTHTCSFTFYQPSHGNGIRNHFCQLTSSQNLAPRLSLFASWSGVQGHAR